MLPWNQDFRIHWLCCFQLPNLLPVHFLTQGPNIARLNSPSSLSNFQAHHILCNGAKNHFLCCHKFCPSTVCNRKLFTINVQMYLQCNTVDVNYACNSHCWSLYLLKDDVILLSVWIVETYEVGKWISDVCTLFQPEMSTDHNFSYCENKVYFQNNLGYNYK